MTNVLFVNPCMFVYQWIQYPALFFVNKLDPCYLFLHWLTWKNLCRQDGVCHPIFLSTNFVVSPNEQGSELFTPSFRSTKRPASYGSKMGAPCLRSSIYIIFPICYPAVIKQGNWNFTIYSVYNIVIWLVVCNIFYYTLGILIPTD